jgi:hypothetical protein
LIFFEKNKIPVNLKIYVGKNNIIIFYFFSIFILLLIGAPIFSDEVDQSKVIFNQGIGIFIIRIIRYVTYILSFYLVFGFISKNINLGFYLFFLFLSSSTLFLLGYKGDVFSTFIIGAMVFYTYYPNYLKITNILTFFTLIFILLFFIVFRYDFNLMSAFDFILTRLTLANAEGLYTLYTFENYIKSIDLFDLLFGNVINKLSSGYDGETLNTLLMTLSKSGQNPDRMQLSTFGIGFTFLYFGIVGVILQVLIMAFVVIYLAKNVVYQKKYTFIKFLFMNYFCGFFYGQEFIINFIDFIISSILAILIIKRFNLINVTLIQNPYYLKV